MLRATSVDLTFTCDRAIYYIDLHTKLNQKVFAIILEIVEKFPFLNGVR